MPPARRVGATKILLLKKCPRRRAASSYFFFERIRGKPWALLRGLPSPVFSGRARAHLTRWEDPRLCPRIEDGLGAPRFRSAFWHCALRSGDLQVSILRLCRAEARRYDAQGRDCNIPPGKFAWPNSKPGFAGSDRSLGYSTGALVPARAFDSLRHRVDNVTGVRRVL